MRPETLRRLRAVLRVLLAVAMVSVGVSHFTNPAPFEAIVPAALPAPHALVLISGVFEILGGLGLLVPPARRFASLGLIALFVAVFPANLNMAINHIQIGATPLSPAFLWGRLPFQALFILWAWWVGRPRARERASRGDGSLMRFLQRGFALLCALLVALDCSPSTPTGPPPPDQQPSPPPPSSSAPAPIAPPWPDLPRTTEAARALIRERSLRDRDLAPPPPIDARALLARASTIGFPSLVVGERRILGWIQDFVDHATSEGRDTFLLIGSYHDSAGQIDAFRRLIGPGGLRGLDLVAVEQFRAAGSWSGVPSEVQLGDGISLDAYIGRGDRASFEILTAHHREGDYAAWKFGYEPTVMDLLVTARATGTALQGCDMPAALQKLLAEVGEDERLRLRELHALLSLPPARTPRRTALLWGQAHVRPGGFRRFLPPGAAVLSLQLFGFRSGQGTVEAELGKHLALIDPVMIPLDDAGSEIALLYPDAPGSLGAIVDRSRIDEPAERGLTVRSTTSATLVLGDQRTPLGPAPKRITIPPAQPSLVIEAGALRFVGAFRWPAGNALELEVDPPRRSFVSIERPGRD